MYENQLMYYGIAGADENYRVVRFYGIRSADYTIENETRIVSDMLDANPGIRRVFVVTNGFGLKKDYRSAVSQNSIESWIIFKDLLERRGREINVRPILDYLKLS